MIDKKARDGLLADNPELAAIVAACEKMLADTEKGENTSLARILKRVDETGENPIL